MIEAIVFYMFSAIAIGAGIGMITVRNPVQSALLLIVAFLASAGLWILLQAEFLGLVLIFVYVGAVMTLFLFVVMMLKLDMPSLKRAFVRYLPLGALIIALLVGLMIMVVGPEHFGASFATIKNQPADYSNTKALGEVLYTHYVLQFEMAAVLLLAAIIAAIALAHRGPRPGTKPQKVPKQLKANKDSRMRIVKMKAEKS